MQDQFHREFEESLNKFYQAANDTLAVYTPFLEALRREIPERISERRALDLVCGDGQWLAELVEHGFTAQGIASDEASLRVCHDLGLEVLHEDPLQTLLQRPDNSLAVVSMLHNIEHLPLGTLLEVMTQAKRVLCPGGLLIMQAPNPECLYNIKDGMTHTHPISPRLFDFVVEKAGFVHRCLAYTGQLPHVARSKVITLNDIVFHASPTFAVIAQKPTHPEIHQCFAPLFKQTYGLSLPEMITRHDQTSKRHMSVALESATLCDLLLQQNIRLREDLDKVRHDLNVVLSRLRLLSRPFRGLIKLWRWIRGRS